ncbi:MAG: Calx-beta domain-containing protein [Vicinamibacterales bacterium]
MSRNRCTPLVLAASTIVAALAAAATSIDITAQSTPQVVSAQALDASGGEVLVNTYKTGAQAVPSVAMRPDNSFVVVWESGDKFGCTGSHTAGSCQDGSAAGIYGQRFDTAGSPVGGEFAVNTFTNNEQYQPAVATRATGEFVVVWTTANQPDSGRGLDVYMRRYDANGVALDPAGVLVSATASAHQERPAVAMDGSGNFVVMWQSFQDATGNNIYGQRYDGSGNALGGEFLVNSGTTAFHQTKAAVARAASGDFIAVWDSEGADGSGQAIRAQRFTAGGVGQGEFAVNTLSTANSQSEAAVAIDANGNFVIAWQDDNSSADGSGVAIYAKRYNAAGQAQGQEFLVNTTTAGNQTLPSVAFESSGGFLVTWSGQDGSGTGVFGRRYSSSGNPVGQEFRINTTTTSNQSSSSASGGNGKMVVVWESENQDQADTAPGGWTPPSGSYAQLFTVTPEVPGVLQLSASTYATDESSNATITVTRTSGSTGAVSATYALTPGTATSVADYTPASATVSLADGETSTTFTVVILDDTVDEPNETLTITLSNAAGGASLGTPVTATLTITDDDDAVPNAKGPFYLAEGATGFFTLDFAVANPNTSPAPIKANFLKPDGSTVSLELTLPATSRSTIKVNDVTGLDSTAVSTVVESKNGLPLVVERTMSWDRASAYGAHTEKAGEGARRQWFFAEGSQGFFDTFILLANPQPNPVTATVTFLVEGETPVTCSYTLAATSRTNVWAGDLLAAGGPSCDAGRFALVNRSFGFTVAFSEPGAAERSMYFGAAPFWSGGHGSVGIAAPATSWYHAEGATGDFFDTYILVANPNPVSADVTYKYLLPSGVAITRTATIPANSRHTVNIEVEHPLLADTAVSTQVTSTLPVVSERAMYWAGPASGWYEAHNSFGLTTIGTKWGIAEGRVGGSRGYETFILLANTTDTTANVTVTYLRTNGTTLTKTYSVPPTSRFNVYVNSFVPELQNEEFSAIIESTQPIAVERALYWNAGGVFWAAGTNATAARLP